MSDGGGPQKAATAAIAAAFLVSLAGSVAFAFAYTVEWGPAVLGTFFAIALGGLGLGLALWSRRLMPPGPFEEDRQKFDVSAEDQEKTAEAFTGGAKAVGRRRLLGGLLAAAGGFLGLAALWPARSLGPRPDERLRDTGWGPGVRLVDADDQPVHREDLPVGGVLTVFPEGGSRAADDQVVLLRVTESELRLADDREEWAPEGYVAYSRVCTHAGCPVGMFQPNPGLLMCPCHQASFDILGGGQSVFGPAPRGLPQLPLRIDEEGILIARDEFPEPVGPDRWRMSRSDD